MLLTALADHPWRPPLATPPQVVKLIGCPSEADLETVMNEGALQLLEGMLPTQASLETTLLHAGPLALGLIRRMLTFNAEKRITAAEAVQHEYLAEYREDDEDEAARRGEPALLSEWLTITGVATLPMEQLQNLIFQVTAARHPHHTHLS